jgi:hypothetical protein
MNKQELIQKCETVMSRKYCNGVSINHESISESNKEVKFHIDYSVPRKILEGDSEQIFYIKLRNVGLIRLSKKGEVLGQSSAEDFIQESIQAYKEIFEKKERFIVKLFAENLIKLEQIHIALTPLRKVLRKLKERDYSVDNKKRNFSENEIKYLDFLTSIGYIRKESNLYTLDNDYIKQLIPNLQKISREEQIEKIIACIFGENFFYIISEMKNTSIVPYIGIIATICGLTLEIQDNIKLGLSELYRLYKEHYFSSQDESSFQDKILDMTKKGLVSYNEDNRSISLPKGIFNTLIENFKLNYKQHQLC